MKNLSKSECISRLNVASNILKIKLQYAGILDDFLIRAMNSAAVLLIEDRLQNDNLLFFGEEIQVS